MHHIRLVPLVLAGLALPASRAHGQRCMAPEHPVFEFQADRPAQFVADSTLRIRPTAQSAGYQNDRSSLLVQFVVDTLGVPDPRTFHALRMPSRAAADSVKLVLSRWRFTPAVVGGCPTPQIVQTLVSRDADAAGGRDRSPRGPE